MGKRRVEWSVGKGAAVDVILASVVLAGITGSAVVAMIKGTDKPPVQTAPKPEGSAVNLVLGSRLYEIGEWASAGSYVMAVKQVKSDMAGAAPFVPGAGRQYLVVDLELTNMGSESLEVAPVAQMYVRDGGGPMYEMAPAPLSTPLEAGELAPGETRQGQISFNVPKQVSDFRLTFDPAPAKAAPVTFDLGNK